MRDAIDSQQLSILRRIAGDFIVVFAAIGIRAEMFAAVFKPSNRKIQASCQPGNRNFLAAQNALIAKAAADVGGNDPDVAIGYVQRFAQAGLHAMRKLRRADDGEVPKPRVPIADDTAALHRKHAVSRCSDMPVNPDVGCFRNLLDCGVFPEFDNPVVAPFVMDERRVRFACQEHVDNGGQFLEFQRNGLRDILGFRPRRGNAHRDQLADVPQLFRRQYRLSGTLEALHGWSGNDRIDVIKIRGREDSVAIFLGDFDLD